MNKQFKIYSVDTKSFFNAEEEKINRQITRCDIIINLIKEYVLTTMVKPPVGKKGQELKTYKFESIADLHKQKRNNKYVKKYIKKLKKDNKQLMKSDEFKEKLKSYKFYMHYVEHEKDEKRKNIPNKLDKLKSELNKRIIANTAIRELNPKKMSKYNLISLFSNDLSRTIKIDTDTITTDLLIVRVYHYPVLWQLVDKGYNYAGEHYICLTASAGQIRTKKVLMIKGKMWNKIRNTIMCGLSIKDINESKEHGCNINKYLAYLSLCSSASDPIENFDIDRTIVIPDYETTLKDKKVDYINNATFEVNEGVKKNITITHSDGCGWILPSESKKSFQIRMPWFKGLMTPVKYLDWCDEYNNDNYKVKDIYGKEWDLKADDIRYVFSKSQFKMWKYYPNLLDENNKVIKYGWDIYKDNFKKYNCHANYCNMEEDTKDFRQAKFNYQMWQTLLSITDKEIEKFTNPVADFITKAYTDRDTMLKILGADKDNKNKSYMQQALEIYPELLHDAYINNQLSSAISKLTKDSKSGKIRINAKNTFLIPDVFAWLQYVFLGEEKVTGILKKKEVSCKLYKQEKKLLVERSPHLYREEAVRNNVINKDTNRWFITNGIYTSCHDLISKILQFDNDGDHALVCAEPKLIKIARKNVKGVLPLYYEMGKADPKIINAKNIYDGLVTGFKYSNIGQFSDKLTALWNKDNITKEDLNTAKVITALNNYCIDAAKTLEMKKLTKGTPIEKAYKEANKLPLPYFFQFAKEDKNANDVAKINSSTVNKICAKIEAIPQGDFEYSQIGKFKSSMLMHNSKIMFTPLDMEKAKLKSAIKVYGKESVVVNNLKEKINDINDIVIEEYKRLNKEMQKYFFKNEAMEKEEIACAVWDIIGCEFDEFCRENNIEYVDAVDIILEHIYKSNPDCKKKLLFSVFGDVIVKNLKDNIKNSLDDGYIMCKGCGKRVEKKNNRQTLCPECAKEKRKAYDRKRKKNE